MAYLSVFNIYFALIAVFYDQTNGFQKEDLLLYATL